MGFVAIYLVVCLNAANPNTCTRLPVTDSTQGQPDDAPMTMSGCMGVEGQSSAIKYWAEHPDLHQKFQYGGWSCQVGNKKAPDRGKA
jgi:hypothetical protein